MSKARSRKRVSAVAGLAALVYASTMLPGILMHQSGEDLGPGTRIAVPDPVPTGAAMASDTRLLGLGREATANEIAAWDIDIRPDGQGLPEGRGDVFTGEEIFADQCAVCHGDFAEGVDRWPALAGGIDTLASDDPVKTVGSYWPYLSTVWDYINRAMPFGYSQSLSPDEVYAITAYILYSNDLVSDEFELSHENFADVRLPNEENFFADDRAGSPIFTDRDACMKNCKTSVTITSRARVLDVTPTTGTDKAAAPGPTAGTDAVEIAAAGPAPQEELEAPEAPAALAEPEIAALEEALIQKGAKVFKKCKACHQVGDGAKNKVGPLLNGIVGASLGAVEGFNYSKSLQARADEGIVWDDATLAAFLAKPKKWLKGTKMSFSGLKKEKDRIAIIEFLKSYSR